MSQAFAATQPIINKVIGHRPPDRGTQIPGQTLIALPLRPAPVKKNPARGGEDPFTEGLGFSLGARAGINDLPICISDPKGNGDY